ncbi:MAG TPA: fatty acid desaturase [Bryobacteraceae bacterium]|nr:fatty acid desaturase [Bryobacteraceae bacterium]
MSATAVRTATAFEMEERRSKELLRDLQSPSPRIYRADLAASSLLGWGAFAEAVRLPFSAASVACAGVAVLALYRCLCFLHEISHINRSGLRGFEAAWNAVVGFPLLMPSFVYVGVHQWHHHARTYGTSQDPEYLPFARSSRMTVLFALESFLIPAALLIRFLILAPVGLLIPAFHQWLVRHASSLTMNFAYQRESTPEVSRRIRRGSALILAGWAAAATLCARGILPCRIFAVWFVTLSMVSFVNTLRTLAAHKYESEGAPLTRAGQLEDSIDVPGHPWTELWAPVGLRYHALHHYFPGVPYHNLPEAHRRLTEALAKDSIYRRVSNRGLWRCLANLYRRGSAG